ncbi:MAG: SprB repeat-containing protein, partial [Flavobacteriales bacterium]
MKKVCLLALLPVAVLFVQTTAFAQCGTTPINGDFIISSDMSLSGTYNITGLFRVDSGVVCTVTPYSSGGCGELVINAADIEIIGDIVGDASGFAGGTAGSAGTAGNNVGALTGCLDKDNCLVVDVDGGSAGGVGSGPGAGLPGGAGTLGMGPKQQCQDFDDEYGFIGGAGGGGSAGGGSYGGLANAGGIGGSGAAYNSGNFSGMDLAGCASPQAGTGGSAGPVGVTYGTPTGTDIELGSGGAGSGGGGKSASNGGVGSSGGAGGGLVVLNATGDLTVAGNISVDGETSGAGGNGGAGAITADCCEDLFCNGCDERTFSSGAGGGGGSGGGSGGGIMLSAFGVTDITGTLRSIGGNGGTGGAGGAGAGSCSHSTLVCSGTSGSTNAGTSGELGGGGSGGRIKVFQNPCQSNNINASILINGGNGFGGVAEDGSYHLGSLGNIIAPTLSSTTDSVSCFGLADGEATVTVNGGTAPFTYSWSPMGGTAATATNLTAGSYDVMVT